MPEIGSKSIRLLPAEGLADWAGFKLETIEAVHAAGAQLTRGQLLRIKVNYLTRCGIFGRAGFVNEVWPGNDQRMVGLSYWEVAVVAAGSLIGKPIRGHGYLVMTGNAGADMRSLFHLEEEK